MGKGQREAPALLASRKKHMSTLKEFGDTAKALAKNPLGIIALFIVLIYGFAALVVGASSQLGPEERYPIVWFLIILILPSSCGHPVH